MIWFKHPNDLPNDKRLATLIDNEGCRGYGMYLHIIEMLCAQPDKKLSFSQLKIISRKGFSKKYMEKIIWEYQLFTIHEEEFESAIDFNYTEKGNHLQNDLKTPKKNEEAKIAPNQLKNRENSKKTDSARVRGEKKRIEKTTLSSQRTTTTTTALLAKIGKSRWTACRKTGCSAKRSVCEAATAPCWTSILMRHWKNSRSTSYSTEKRRRWTAGRKCKATSRTSPRPASAPHTNCACGCWSWTPTGRPPHLPTPTATSSLWTDGAPTWAAPSPTERHPDRTIPPSGTKRPVRGLRKPHRLHRKS